VLRDHSIFATAHYLLQVITLTKLNQKPYIIYGLVNTQPSVLDTINSSKHKSTLDWFNLYYACDWATIYYAVHENETLLSIYKEELIEYSRCIDDMFGIFLPDPTSEYTY